MGTISVNDNALLIWDEHKSALQGKLGELVQYFQISVPADNVQGLPHAYIDPTILMPLLLEVETPDEIDDDKIREATIPIEYDEGLPTVGGIPLWERLDGEPVPYYKIFKEYRELKYTEGSRSIAKLADMSGMAGRQLSALSRIYHWQMRVKTYDRYKEFERQLRRKREIETLTDKHGKAADKMLEQACDYLDKHPEQLSPKTAIQLAELAMRAGRLALGLNPDKPGEIASSTGHQTNITIAQNNVENMQQANISAGAPGAGNGASKEDLTNLQSVLHVLSKSGALNAAVLNSHRNSVPLTNTIPNVIDVNAEPNDTDGILDREAEAEIISKAINN